MFTRNPRSGTFSTQGSAPGLLSLSGTWASFLPCLPWASVTPPSLDVSCACPCAFFSVAHSSCPRVRTATATFSHPATRHSMPPSLLYFSPPQLTAAQASALVLQLSHFALPLPLPFTQHTAAMFINTTHRIRLRSSSHQGKQSQASGCSHVLNTSSSTP